MRAGAKTIKLIGDFGPAREILVLNPSCLIIGRLFTQWNPVAAFVRGQSPEAAVQEFLFEAVAGNQFQTYAANPLIKVWEGPNEPVFPRADGMAWYAVFEGLRAKILAEHKLQAVIGNFSTGTPPLEWWESFLPALRALKVYPGYLGVHEYSAPTMQWMTGHDADGVLRGWTTLRYRRVYQILEHNGLGDTPLLITELGVDPGAKPYPSPWKGKGDLGAFRDDSLRKIWAAGLPALSAAEYNYSFPPSSDPDRFYAEQLEWYDQETLKDAYVKGTLVFEVGGSWGRFNLDEQPIIGMLEAYIVNASVVPSPPAPAPTGTHQVVNAVALNVREFPWVGDIEPRKMGLLPGSTPDRPIYVTVYGTFKTPAMLYGWALVGKDGNRWVSMKYLEPRFVAQITSRTEDVINVETVPNPKLTTPAVPPSKKGK